MHTYAIVAPSIMIPAANCKLYFCWALACDCCHEPCGTSTSSILGGLSSLGTWYDLTPLMLYMLLIEI